MVEHDRKSPLTFVQRSSPDTVIAVSCSSLFTCLHLTISQHTGRSSELGLSPGQMPLFAFYCCDTHNEAKQLQEGRVYLAKRFQSITVGNQGRNARQELKQRPLGGHSLLACPHGLLSLLSYVTL